MERKHLSIFKSNSQILRKDTKKRSAMRNLPSGTGVKEAAKVKADFEKVITVDSGNPCCVKLQKNVFCFDC